MAVDSRDVGARVRSRLLGPAGADLDTLSPPERRLRVRDEVMTVLKEARMILPSSVVTQVVNQVSDEVVGLGPIERLLKDPEVSEVMVNGADDVYVERKGRVERVDGLVFEGEGQVFHLKNQADRKSTRLNSSHSQNSYAVFCLKKKKKTNDK